MMRAKDQPVPVRLRPAEKPNPERIVDLLRWLRVLAARKRQKAA